MQANPAPRRAAPRVRRRSLGAWLLTGIGTGSCAATPGAVDGRWVASSEHQASTLTLVLRSRDAQVSGDVLDARGALPVRGMPAKGTYEPPLLRLSWTSGDGSTWSLKARLVDRERLQGTLHWPGGTEQPIALVRP